MHAKLRQVRDDWGIYSSLFWKEWHEQRWRLMVILTLALPFYLMPFLLILFNHNGQQKQWMMPPTSVLYVLAVAPFTAMSIAGGEHRRRTVRFLQALPTDLAKAASAKLLVAALVVSAPIIFAIVIAILHWIYLSATGRNAGPTIELIILNALTFASVNSLLLWMTAGGMNQQDEIRAGAVGFLTCAMIWFGLFLFVAILEEPNSLIALGAGLPGGTLILDDFIRHRDWMEVFLGIFFALFTNSLAVLWYLRRYGRAAVPPHRGVVASKLERFTFRKPTADAEVLSPFKYPLQAIIWKQVRETGPLVVLALAGVLVGAMAIYARTLFGYTRMPPFSELLSSIAMITAIFVLIVAGIGVFFEDLSPKTYVFWRSRPIDVNQWFGLKWTTGFLVPALGFGGLLLVALILKPDILSYPGRVWWQGVASFAGGMLLAALVVYSLSVCYYVLFRQAIYAALAVIGTIVVVHLTMAFVWYRIGNPDGPYLLGWVTVPVLATVVAWQAIRRDWGWKEGR